MSTGVERARRALPFVLVPVGSLLVVLGVVAGYANHVLLDGPTFAGKVDAVRQAEPVSRVLGRTLTDQYLARQPNLVALRPLIDSVAASAVASPAFSRPTRAAAEAFQQAATVPNASSVGLRIADAGAVLTAVLQQAVPAAQQSPPSTVALSLAHIGGQKWSHTTFVVARLLGVAAWVLPLSGLAVLATDIVLARRRRRASLVTGAAVLGWTAVAAALLFAGDRWAAGHDATTMHGVLVRYAWAEFTRPLWWWLAAVALLALIVMASAAALLPEYDAGRLVVRARELVARRPRRFAADLARALVFVVVGVATLVDPLDAARVAGIAVGALLVLYGIAEVGRATNDEEITQAREASAGIVARVRRTRPIVAVAVLAVLLTTTGYVAWAVSSTGPGPDENGPVAGDGLVCNGFAALCDRPFDEVSFAATHNSMAVAGQPGWFLGEQGVSIIGQLDNGVRALTIDVWPGQARVRGGVATAPESYAAAKALATEQLGPEVVDAGLRVFNAVTDPRPSGPPALYLCHGLCELGATSFAAAAADIRAWLDENPDQVLTIIIERHAPAAQIGALLTASGLAAYAFTPVPGAPWPTLRQMVTSGHRLVVMLETEDGGTAYPWLVDGYSSFLQETPYTFRTAADFSCAPNRGVPTAPLFLVNHWIFGFRSLVTDARAVNSLAVLGARVEKCRVERRLPNFVSVNYADIGDLQQVVDDLNGVS